MLFNFLPKILQNKLRAFKLFYQGQKYSKDILLFSKAANSTYMVIEIPFFNKADKK